jgi:DNA-binding NarL/FixJ family response regulator
MIRIFLADDHDIVREGIISVLHRERDLKVVGEAGDGREAIEKIRKTKPDVIIIDISMPNMNGIEVMEELLREQCPGKFIILTQHEKEEYIRLAMHAGASGYLVKYSITKDIIDAIRAVSRGEVFFSTAISTILLRDYVQAARQKSAPQTDLDLTNRETEVLQLIAGGLSSRQIAEKLSLSTRTIEFHRANIIQKLGIRDVAGLTRYAIKHGLAKI